jgi:hypothetical protein
MVLIFATMSKPPVENIQSSKQGVTQGLTTVNWTEHQAFKCGGFECVEHSPMNPLTVCIKYRIGTNEALKFIVSKSRYALQHPCHSYLSGGSGSISGPTLMNEVQNSLKWDRL